MKDDEKEPYSEHLKSTFSDVFWIIIVLAVVMGIGSLLLDSKPKPVVNYEDYDEYDEDYYKHGDPSVSEQYGGR